MMRAFHEKAVVKKRGVAPTCLGRAGKRPGRPEDGPAGKSFPEADWHNANRPTIR